MHCWACLNSMGFRSYHFFVDSHAPAWRGWPCSRRNLTEPSADSESPCKDASNVLLSVLELRRVWKLPFFVDSHAPAWPGWPCSRRKYEKRNADSESPSQGGQMHLWTCLNSAKFRILTFGFGLVKLFFLHQLPRKAVVYFQWVILKTAIVFSWAPKIHQLFFLHPNRQITTD